ncbi:DEKNAAC100264 [Brettanomyces naardenensis]|uniref:DEKNAAC100264 n=1 Tax=Brettanomyces naardenensis TaxID=13370 RepID=A0A448YFW3_BRENA|nr:DEKNAAC100264 [Brettanomyces naardenensis]
MPTELQAVDVEGQKALPSLPENGRGPGQLKSNNDESTSQGKELPELVDTNGKSEGAEKSSIEAKPAGPEISTETSANNNGTIINGAEHHTGAAEPVVGKSDGKLETPVSPHPDNSSVNGSIRSPRLSTHSTPQRRRSSTSTLLTETAGIAFLKDTLERIISIKEVTRKHPNLVASAKTAIGILQAGEMPSEAVIFEPLKLACEQRNVAAKILALDCLGKIFTFNIFNQPIYIKYTKSTPEVKADAEMEANVDAAPGSSEHAGEVPLIEAVIEVISSCFDGEGTDERVELQIIRVLTAALANESMPVHGKALLQAVRQMYNIFLLSLSSVNQGIAQATLIQIVNITFDKCEEFSRLEKEQDNTVDDQVLRPTEPNQRMTLEEIETSLQGNDVIQLSSDEIFGDEKELCIKDAFLIIRSMSNLAAKTIESESIDVRSHAVRSKLLSLNIIYFILKDHIDVFLDKKCLIFTRNNTEKTILVDGIRKYLCLVLSRNAASQLAPVYEVTLELFWLMISKLRDEFKYEIPVFLNEIYFPVSEMKTSTPHQKRYLLDVIRRLCNDPKALIEVYLNYDCDPSMSNLTEKIIEYLTRYALAKVEATASQKVAYKESLTRSLSLSDFESIPELNVNRLSNHSLDPEWEAKYPIAYALKMASIDSIVSFLKSLNSRSGKPVAASTDDAKSTLSSSSVAALPASPNSSSSVSVDHLRGGSDDSAPQFESIKQQKTAYLECTKLFDFSPKKGIKALVRNHFIDDDKPETIALFLLTNDSLDKSAIGEYLGEGHEENIAIMHSFVDMMDFKEKTFLNALRFFLQHFRLPGESQKIDRFMLKFSEKYVNDNPTAFANADTVYVLSYSVVLLNTDLHSPQVKDRMTLEEFVKNNRGIDDGKDLDSKLLEQIYMDIQNHEIILKSERQAALISNSVEPRQSIILFGGRDIAKEAYLKASKEMTNKTEQAVKSLRSSSRDNSKAGFYTLDDAESSYHVKSMYETLWMSLLAGLTPPFKEYDDEDTAKLLLLGIRISIHLACIFGLDYARTSFIRALVQFTNINNPDDLKVKNIDAITTILNIAINDQNDLKNSWKGIFIVISQVERLKLLSRGVNSDAVPDLLNARLANRSSLDSLRSQTSVGFFASFNKKQSMSEQTFHRHFNQKLPVDSAARLNSTEMDVAMDKVFSKSSEIEGDGIFDFIAGLSEVAREEIESSGSSDQPRMFSLQKLVDVCYYNMGRIRVQWSALWAVLNEIFNEFGCHTNAAISFFAIDSLRQLSERFFSIEELAHFKFQKDFLQPFNYIMMHNPNLAVRDMVLDCVRYMVVRKSSLIRSGWSTLVEVLTNAAVDDSEQLVSKGYDYVNMICEKHFEEVFKEEGFEPLVICLTEYAKNDKFQKTSLRALHNINGFVQIVSEKTENETDEERQSQLWFPVLFGFHDVIMEGEDLEVRAQALKYMFDALVNFGHQFGRNFWFRVSEELLFPIFGILSQHWQLSTNQEDLWVWLSSTLIQALRRMIALFTTYYSTLSGMVDGYLGLLVSCICQENETISKVGISCLQDLILQNITKFGPEEWSKIDKTFEDLFELTRATELFDADPLRAANKKEESEPNGDSEEEDEDNEDGGGEDDNEPAGPDLESALNGSDETRVGSGGDDAITALKISRQKSTIVIKCVLQLHMIQTLSELFGNDVFYDNTPVEQILKLADLLNSSYRFARDFNEDYNLRVRLWNSGVMDKLPNLLKQETSAVGVYISVMFRLYCDGEKASKETRKEISQLLMPLSVSLLQRYVQFDEKEQARNIQSWTPVVVETLQACTEMDEIDFKKVCPLVYELVLRLFDKSMTTDLRLSTRDFLSRVGDLYVEERQEERK